MKGWTREGCCVVFLTATALLAVACSSEPPSAGESGEALSAPIALTTALQDALDAGLSCNGGLVIAGAIAMAESSLIPDNFATNPPTSGCPQGSTDRGIWQINSCYQSQYSLACVYDPACNATAMAAISGKGTNWEPWGSYNSGRYKQFLPASQAAYARVCGVGSGSGSGSAGGGSPPSGSGSGSATGSGSGSATGGSGDAGADDAAADGEGCAADAADDCN